ncbi:MAG: (2Fe-2S)-binding protein [Acidimicrobiia bacterium]|nr:(2Fe-2S)-binding protein [Acidimicrobiia bacterium]
MIVCHCLAINDRLIEAVAEGQLVTVEDVIQRCGAGTRCGGCRESIQQVLDEARQRNETPLSITASR